MANKKKNITTAIVYVRSFSDDLTPDEILEDGIDCTNSLDELKSKVHISGGEDSILYRINISIEPVATVTSETKVIIKDI